MECTPKLRQGKLGKYRVATVTDVCDRGFFLGFERLLNCRRDSIATIDVIGTRKTHGQKSLDRGYPLEARAAIAFQGDLGYRDGMEDLKLEVPVTGEVEVDAKTLAAIDRGTADADAGRVVSLEEARKLVPQWISKFESPKPR